MPLVLDSSAVDAIPLPANLRDRVKAFRASGAALADQLYIALQIRGA